MLCNLNGQEQEKLHKIVVALGAEEILSQLSEECCELGQAAQKLRRVLHNTTPVSMEKAILGLEEEIGDVFLTLDGVERIGLFSFGEVLKSAHEKNDRWYGRIFDESNADISNKEKQHGLWKYYHKQGIAVCTCCSFERKLDDDFGRAISCPNCGAKIDCEENNG